MLTFEETFDLLPTTGWFLDVEAKLMWDTVKSLAGDVLEIGTYCGRSARLISEAIQTNQSRRFYCCDPWVEGFDGVKTPVVDQILISVLNALCQGPAALQVSLCRMVESKLYEYWTKSHRLSLVFIDGDHSKEATLGAIQRWAPLADKVALHDFGGMHRGVAEAVHEYKFKKRLALAGRLAVFE